MELEAHEADRQIETARARAPRIQIDDAIALCDLGFVGVTADHDAKTGRVGIEIQLGEVVKHVEQLSSYLDDAGERLALLSSASEAISPFTVVVLCAAGAALLAAALFGRRTEAD